MSTSTYKQHSNFQTALPYKFYTQIAFLVFLSALLTLQSCDDPSPLPPPDCNVSPFGLDPIEFNIDAPGRVFGSDIEYGYYVQDRNGEVLASEGTGRAYQTGTTSALFYAVLAYARKLDNENYGAEDSVFFYGDDYCAASPDTMNLQRMPFEQAITSALRNSDPRILSGLMERIGKLEVEYSDEPIVLEGVQEEAAPGSYYRYAMHRVNEMIDSIALNSGSKERTKPHCGEEDESSTMFLQDWVRFVERLRTSSLGPNALQADILPFLTTIRTEEADLDNFKEVARLVSRDIGVEEDILERYIRGISGKHLSNALRTSEEFPWGNAMYIGYVDLPGAQGEYETFYYAFAIEDKNSNEDRLNRVGYYRAIILRNAMCRSMFAFEQAIINSGG